jgi:predicted lipoprotein with Yx(FWY)xxD motif
MRRPETTTGQAQPTPAPHARTRHPEPPGPGGRAVLLRAVMLRVAGAGLLIAAGAIHLDLYLTGYRTIPAIGWLFLLQVIAAFALGLAVLATGGRPAASRLAAAAGAGFALATLGGYLLSVWTGLFGFREVRTTAGLAAGVIDAATTPAGGPAATPSRFPAQIPPALTRPAATTAAALAAAALVLLAVAVAGASPAASASGSAGLTTTVIGGTTVLTNARGFTLYSFAPDTPATSKCYGSCAAYWPPVTGTAPASPGLPGTIGAITRTGGARQLTYNGHPLYTYIGDSAPGQANGNNLNLNGGLWHEVTVSR